MSTYKVGIVRCGGIILRAIGIAGQRIIPAVVERGRFYRFFLE